MIQKVYLKTRLLLELLILILQITCLVLNCLNQLFVYIMLFPCVNNYVEIVVWKFVLAPCKRWSDCLWHEKQDVHDFLLIIELKTDTNSLLIIIAYILTRNKT